MPLPITNTPLMDPVNTPEGINWILLDPEHELFLSIGFQYSLIGSEINASFNDRQNDREMGVLHWKFPVQKRVIFSLSELAAITLPTSYHLIKYSELKVSSTTPKFDDISLCISLHESDKSNKQ